MRRYNVLIFFTIIAGLYGEVIAIWGTVGLVQNTGVISGSVCVSIGLAGILSALAMDRLLLEIRSNVVPLVRTIWLACVTASVVVTWYWIFLLYELETKD